MSDDDKASIFLIEIENTQANTQGTGKLMFYSLFLSLGTDYKIPQCFTQTGCSKVID